MLRRPCIRSLNAAVRGAPPKLRKDIKSVKVIHGAQKPPKPADIDFSKLKLSYPIIHTPEKISPSGWSAKPDIEVDYPFFVERTIVGNSLPVYTDYKHGRTKVITILRRCGGDIQTLRDEMQKVCDNRTVRICTGRLEVDGNFVLRLKHWLIGLGF